MRANRSGVRGRACVPEPGTLVSSLKRLRKAPGPRHAATACSMIGFAITDLRHTPRGHAARREGVSVGLQQIACRFNGKWVGIM